MKASIVRTCFGRESCFDVWSDKMVCVSGKHTALSGTVLGCHLKFWEPGYTAALVGLRGWWAVSITT